jgi:threonine/homoserine/homoserine lactone efflux protein
MTDPLVFALAVLTILVTPGPTNTLLALAGAGVGLRGAWPYTLAEALGYGISISLIGVVLKPILAGSPEIAVVLRVVVAGYLLYLAWRCLRAGRLVAGSATVITPRRVFVTTLLNPKAMVFALGVIPFGAPNAACYLLGFLAILIPVSLGWIALGAALGRAASGSRYERWVLRGGALAITGFATWLLISVARFHT